eukprot:7578081-Pyramimonas_sp.AAC.2
MGAQSRDASAAPPGGGGGTRGNRHPRKTRVPRPSAIRACPSLSVVGRSIESRGLTDRPTGAGGRGPDSRKPVKTSRPRTPKPEDPGRRTQGYGHTTSAAWRSAGRAHQDVYFRTMSAAITWTRTPLFPFFSDLLPTYSISPSSAIFNRVGIVRRVRVVDRFDVCVGRRWRRPRVLV